MQIKRFVAQNIFGNLNFSVQFNKDLTFLTGINGSGKTTIVNSIVALLQPSLIYLINTEFESIELKFTRGKETNQKFIKATQKDNILTLEYSELDSKLEIDIKDKQRYSSLHERNLEILYRRKIRDREYENEFLKEINYHFRNHPVVDAIEEIPNPIYLGIDRRIEESDLTDNIRTPILRRSKKAIEDSRDNLDAVVFLIAMMAENVYRNVDAKKRRLEEKLRKQILLSAISYSEDISFIRDGKITIDTEDLEYIKERKTVIRETFTNIGLTKKEVDTQLNPFFSQIEKLIKVYSNLENKDDDPKISELSENFTEEDQLILLSWLSNSPQYNRLSRIFNLVDEYISDAEDLFNPIQEYLNNINQFLADSQKELFFSDRGELTVKNQGRPSSVLTLSSGEKQMVVMLTQLSFISQDEKRLFIVDEPELSLHVRWQELFVEAIMNANKNIQIILATHSPSIILDQIKYCVDISNR